MTLEEVIKFTKQALENVNPDKRVHTEFRLTVEQVKQLLQWLEDYKRLQSVSSWIPCSERMPDKDGDFLCVRNGEIQILPYRNGEFYGIYFDRILRCCNSSVSHWMPTPELPKEVHHDEN